MNTQDSIARARKAYEGGDFKSSAKLFESILEIRQEAQLFYEHALCLLRLEKKKVALKQLDRALELEPKNPFRYSSRAYVKDAVGDIHGAIEDYRSCIRIDPEDAIAHNNLGLLYDKLGRREAAKHHIKQADLLSDAREYLENQKIREKAEAGDSSAEQKKDSLGSEVLKVFKDKKSRSEFFTFVRKGWKL